MVRKSEAMTAADVHKLVMSEIVRRRREGLGVPVDPEIILGIVKQESAFNPWAIRHEPNFRWLLGDDPSEAEFSYLFTQGRSDTEKVCQKTSWGLMQIMGSRGREFFLKGYLTYLLDPVINISIGISILSLLAVQYPGSTDDIISAYNQGSPRKNDNGAYLNQSYVDKVNKYALELKDELSIP
jgi:hypothetical protein